MISGALYHLQTPNIGIRESDKKGGVGRGEGGVGRGEGKERRMKSWEYTNFPKRLVGNKKDK